MRLLKVGSLTRRVFPLRMPSTERRAKVRPQSRATDGASEVLPVTGVLVPFIWAPGPGLKSGSFASFTRSRSICSWSLRTEDDYGRTSQPMAGASTSQPCPGRGSWCASSPAAPHRGIPLRGEAQQAAWPDLSCIVSLFSAASTACSEGSSAAGDQAKLSSH